MQIDITEEAVKKTAEETAEMLFPVNQMSWKQNRENFVQDFLEQFRGNYTKLSYPNLFKVA